MEPGSIANKEAAEQCYTVGKAALQAGDLPKAIRMLERSMNLYPVPGAKELLVAAQNKSQQSSSNSNSNSSSSSSSTAGGGSSSRGSDSSNNNSNSGSTSNRSAPQRPSFNDNSASSPSSSSSPKAASSANAGSFTPEQEDGAKKILRAAKRSHYEVLGIKKSASEAEIKKAYRNMARLYHPDRNKAPSSESAFKAINTANDTLIDAAKREAYDTYGHDDGIINGNSGGGGGGGGYHPYHSSNEMSPEDIFRMFFTGGVPRGQQYRQQQQQYRHAGGGAGGMTEGGIKQLIPIIVFVLFIIMSSFGNSPEQVYSFTKQSPYIYSYKTASQHDVIPDIPFYTNIKNFDKEYLPYSSKRKTLEKTIERDYSDFTYYKCLNEKERRQAYINRAKNDWLGKYNLEQAQATPTPFCDTYNDFFVNDKNKKKTKPTTTTASTSTTSTSTTSTNDSSSSGSSKKKEKEDKDKSSTTKSKSSLASSCEGVTLQVPVPTDEIAPVGVMYGPAIGSNGGNNAEVPIQAIKRLNGGNKKVFMIQDGINTKMVSSSGEARYYKGTIAQFDPARWSSYTLQPQNSYMLKDVWNSGRSDLTANNGGTTQSLTYFQCEGSNFCCIDDCYKQNLANCGDKSFCGCYSGSNLFTTYIAAAANNDKSAAASSNSMIHEL